VARAYTVYLELVNVSENAYRTHRLRERARATEPSREPPASANVVFVLTAHPTESRSPMNIRLMRRIQTLLLEGLERRDPPDRERLEHLLHLVWAAGTHPAHKPSVEDEALHLFSLLDDPVLEELLAWDETVTGFACARGSAATRTDTQESDRRRPTRASTSPGYVYLSWSPAASCQKSTRTWACVGTTVCRRHGTAAASAGRPAHRHHRRRATDHAPAKSGGECVCRVRATSGSSAPTA
jgi:hypothetical protein